MAGELAALILAAGYGSRIHELTRYCPKPLLPIGLTTPLALITNSLRAAGIQRIVANAAYHAQALVDAGQQLSIDVVVETNGPLGTAGGLAATQAQLNTDAILIWAGDLIADINVSQLYLKLLATPNAKAVFTVSNIGPAHTGNVGIGMHGQVVRLRNESFNRLGQEHAGADFVPVHIMRRSLAQQAPNQGCLIRDVYMPALDHGAFILTNLMNCNWFDIGSIHKYVAANFSQIGTSNALLGNDIYVESGIQLHQVVLGKNSHTTGYGILNHVIVWPGAYVHAPLEHALVLNDPQQTVLRIQNF